MIEKCERRRPPPQALPQAELRVPQAGLGQGSGSGVLVPIIQIHYNTNTNTLQHKYKYKYTTTQIQIHISFNYKLVSTFKYRRCKIQKQCLMTNFHELRDTTGWVVLYYNATHTLIVIAIYRANSLEDQKTAPAWIY